MKKIIFLTVILVITASVAFAARNVEFGWDYDNPPADLAGFRLYQSNQSGVYVFGPGDDVAEIAPGDRTVIITVEDGTWYWVLTAFDTAGNESVPSNEITASIDSVPPPPPRNLWQRILDIIISWLKGHSGFRVKG